MKNNITSVLTVVATFAIATPLTAENLNDLNRLLGSKKCQQCDLTNAGLIHANLTGADLSGASLLNANLSQANLAGADLSGANLTGASLYGANLTGANLTGANLAGTDLRNAYLIDATLKNVDLDQANLNGVKGISPESATPEQFHRWGVREAERGNFPAAIAHYQRAIAVDAEFAPAYLGLAIIYFRNNRQIKALDNTKVAISLFEQQENELGESASQEFLNNMELATQIEASLEQRKENASNFDRFLGGIGSLLLRLVL